MVERTDSQETERMRNILAFMLVGAFIALIPVFVFFTVPEKNEQVITYVAGQLSGMALMALGYYFVSKVGQDQLDAKKADNTGKMADAMTAVAQANTTNTVSQIASEAADQVANAATDEADRISGNG